VLGRSRLVDWWVGGLVDWIAGLAPDFADAPPKTRLLHERRRHAILPLPRARRAIVDAGGLIPYARKLPNQSLLLGLSQSSLLPTRTRPRPTKAAEQGRNAPTSTKGGAASDPTQFTNPPTRQSTNRLVSLVVPTVQKLSRQREVSLI
jgi:hypothetical protein